MKVSEKINIIANTLHFFSQSWIVEKSRLLASVEDPGADLSSVITLQRRLHGIERDIAALPMKVSESDLDFSSLFLYLSHVEDGFKISRLILTLETPTPKNGQTHSDNLSAVAGKMFECV